MRYTERTGNTWFRRALALLIVFVLLLGEMGPLASLDWGWAMPVNAEQTAGFAGGDGGKDTPYKIATEAQLRYFAGLTQTDTQGKYYKLTADITLTEAWVPVWGFAGHFDGSGHSINNMTVSASYNTTKELGLFGMIYAGASIQNVKLKNVNINVTQTADKTMSVGALVGKIEYIASSAADTVIDNCSVSGSINVTANAIAATGWTGIRVGGLIGNLDANASASGTVTVRNCFNEAAVTVTATSGGGSVVVGGISGYMGAAGANVVYHILNSGSIGTLTASTTVQQGFVGGIVGWTKSASTASSVDNCYSAGAMTGGKKIGNIAAQQTNTTNNWQRLYGLVTGGSISGTVITAAQVTDGTLLGYLNTNKTTVTGALNWAANTAGYPVPTTAAVEVPVDVVVSWTAPENGTLVITKADSTQVSNPETLPSGTVLTVKVTPEFGYVLKQLTVNGTPVTVTEGSYELTLPKENVALAAEFEAVEYKWTDTEVVATAFAGGDGQEATPYEIANGAQLAYLATLSNTEGKYYKLMADIDLSAHEWVPIKGFAGHFDGDGHTVKGLNIENTASVSDIGLFGTVLGGATVKNVILEDVSINVTVAAVKGRVSAAAVVGRIDIITKAGEVVIDNCAVIGNSAVSVTTNHTAWEVLGLGGIVGTAVPNSSSGASTVRIINCFNAADLTATENGGKIQIDLGGIAGAAYCDDAITGVYYYMVNCGNIGDLTATSSATKEVGGLAGRFRSKATDGTSTVNNCYSTGTITGPGTRYPIVNTKGGNGQTISNTYYYYAESVNNSTQSTALTAAQVTDGTLLGYLKTNKMTITGALNWAANTEGYPAPTTVVEVPVDVVVSWTAPENGTLVITKADSTQVSNPETLPSGTVLTVKATPDTGYILKELTVNGTPVTVTGGIFYLELPREESVTIVAQFQEIRYLWTDPEVVGTAFAGGDGQAATPYEIADGAQLAYLATRSDTEGKYYKLTADIDLSAHQWVPIKGFAGHFDGDGHTVKGLTVVNEEGVSDIGLFGTILGGSSVKNVVLKNVKIDTAVAADTGRISAGALVGRIDIITKAGEVDIINCMVLGNSSICVTANHSKWELLGLGGIVGTAVPNNSSGASTVRIINCFNAADLTATENGGNLQVELGGIVGAAYCDDAITGVNYYLVNCGNTGDLTANSTTTKEIGGIAGRFRTKAANSISVINNCYNTGVITGASRLCPIVFTHAGGTEQSIENVYYCVADGSEVTDTTGAEKLTAQQVTDGTLLDKLNLQTAKLGTLGYDGVHQWAAGQDKLPAPTGEKIIVRDVKVSVSNTTEKLGTVRVEINGKEVTTWPQTVKSGTVLTIIGTPVKGYKVSDVTVNGKPVENVANTTNVTVTEDVNTVKVKFDKIRFWTDDGAFASAFAGGLGTQEEPYQIADGAQLAYMAKEMQAGKNFADTHFQLTDNIDLSKYEWVTMLCINKNAQGNVVYQAFAGHFDGNGKTVTGLRIDTQANPSKLPHAGLFGIVSGSVKNLTVQGKINVKDTGVSFGGVGLIAGYLQGGTVTDCSAKGTVTAVRTQAYVGGIAGIAEAGSSIINCVNYASISAGHTGKDLTDANGNPIVATGRIGGIAGYVIAGGAAKAGVVVANCANIGSVTATAGNMNEVAGIAGRVENNPNNGQTISIFNCYNAGKITGGKNTKETLLGNILARKAQDGKLENDFLYAASELKDPSVVIVNVQSNMKSKTFAATLSKNTASLASNGIAGLRKWNTVTDGCPVPTGKSVKVPDFQVSKPKVTGGKVEILMDGQKVTSFPLTVKGGTVLTIICTPSSGNILRDVSINDEAIVNPVSPVVVKITSDSTIKVKFGPPEYWNEEGIAAADYAGGDGSWSNPYQIYNGAQLGYIAKQSLEGETFAGKYFVLTDNIDLSAYKWTPIKEFAGYFNGRGYTVYGMNVNKTTNESEAIGLFGTVYGGASVKNLNLSGVSVTVKQTESVATNVGGLIGQVVIDEEHTGKVTIDKCSVSGKISVSTNVSVPYCDTAVGGILGYTKPTASGGVLISNCFNSASVSLDDKGTARNGQLYAAGIAGHVDTAVSWVKLQILNCGNTGAITASGKVNQARVAGIVGRLRQDKDEGIKAQISNCYNAGYISTGSVSIGGDWATLSVGSVIGQGRNLNLGAMNWRSGTASNVGFNQSVAALSGDFMRSEAFVETLNKNVQAMADIGIGGMYLWVSTNGGYPVLGNGPTVPVKDSWITDENAATSFGGGNGSASQPYQINTPAQLGYLAKQALSGETYKGKYFVLTRDIDLSAHQWIPIKKFEGTFNGNGHTVQGMKIGTAEAPVERMSTNEWGAGLFNHVVGTVRNLTVDGAVYVTDTMSGQHFGTAIIVGHLTGTLDNCTAKGVVTAMRTHAFAGGVAGVAAAGATVINCANEASVYGGSPENITRLGGIAGYAVVGRNSESSILIANCYNTGTISAIAGNAAKVAGLIGNTENNNGTHTISIYNCYQIGEIKQETGATGSLLANSCATKSGKGIINVMHLYAGKPAALEAITETVVTGNLYTEAFAEELTINADLLVGDKLCSNLLSWVGEDGKNPTFGEDRVTGTLAKLDIISNNDRMGLITVVGDETGGDNFVPITKKAVEKGTNVQITIQPKSCIKLTSVKVNGEEKLDELKDGVLALKVDEAVTVEITFEVEKTVDLDPIYVSANGAAGGDGTEEKPFATLAEAQAKLREQLAVYPTGNITVYLMDGTYRLSETLKLTEEDSSFGRVIITGCDGATPVISGGQATGQFEKVEGEAYYSYQLPDSAKIDGQFPLSHDLFVNGERATLARTEDMVFQYGFENVVMTENGKYVDYADNSWYINQELLADVPDDELRFVELSYLQEWKHTMLHLVSRNNDKVQGTEVNVTMDTDEMNDLFAYCATLKSPVGETYWLQNHLSFLDKPGEYYYDQAKGIIYYMPYSNQDMATAQIEYGTLDILVELDHAENITIDGIDFDGATSNWLTENGQPGQLSGVQYGKTPGWGDCGEPIPCAAIYGDYSTGIKIVNCIFEELGGSAIIFRYGTKDLEIIGNRMRNLGMNAVQVGVAQLKWNQDGIPGQAENVTISNNYVTNIGTTNLASPAIAVKRAENLAITHNTIIHTPYSGITAGWGFDHTFTDEASLKNLVNVEIAYNYIEDFIHKNNDGGGIYVCGANGDIFSPEPFNFIHDNYIRAGAHNKTYTGIYHDGSSSNWRTYHNFVDDLRSAKSPMFFQDDVQTQYTHNIVAELNFTTGSAIIQNGSLDLLENYRNIYLTDNTVFENRGAASEEALEIMRNAGIEAEYAHLERPMSAQLRIANNSMHYEISLKTFNNAKMHIELTNNTDEVRSYTIVPDTMPEGYALTVNDGKAVKVKPGQTVIVEGEFSITDKVLAKDVGDQVIGLVVTDSTGRETEYPRALTIRGVNRIVEDVNDMGSPFDLAIVLYIGIGVTVLAAAAVVIVIIRRRRKTSR